MELKLTKQLDKYDVFILKELIPYFRDDKNSHQQLAESMIIFSLSIGLKDWDDIKTRLKKAIGKQGIDFIGDLDKAKDTLIEKGDIE